MKTEVLPPVLAKQSIGIKEFEPPKRVSSFRFKLGLAAALLTVIFGAALAIQEGAISLPDSAYRQLRLVASNAQQN